jgi:Resolvase, N terminal domain
VFVHGQGLWREVGCLGQLKTGDVLVVWRLDRLGRSMRHLIDLVDQLRQRGIGFKSLCDGAIDTITAIQPRINKETCTRATSTPIECTECWMGTPRRRRPVVQRRPWPTSPVIAGRAIATAWSSYQLLPDL